MDQIPMSIQRQYNNNINPNNNYTIPKNNIYHGKSSSYSIPNRKQIIINPIQNNQYNYSNQIPNNYYNTNIDFDTNSNYNKYNVTNNFYGNQIINNNINYISSSRNTKDIQSINNPLYNNIINNTLTQPNSSTNNFVKYNNIDAQSYNRVIKLNSNSNMNQNLILENNYMIQTPKSDMNFMKKKNSKEKFKSIIKNIDVNMDYQENNINNNTHNINFQNKNNLKIEDYNNDNIAYFDISNFRSNLMKMNNVKVINNSNIKHSKINTYNNPNENNINNITNTNNTSRKSSKVKNKIFSRIPHNKMKKSNNIINASNIHEKTNIKFNSSQGRKTKSKIPINMKRKINEIKKVQILDDESESNNQLLFNTNTFSEINMINNFNDKKEKNIDNKTNRINKEKEIINKDNNIDEISEKSEKYKSIKQIKSLDKRNSKYKTSTESDESKIKSDILSMNTTSTHYINNENIDNINIDTNINQNKEQKNKNVKNKIIMIKHSKAKSYMIDKKTANKINKDSEKENEKNEINSNNDNQLEENILAQKINSIRIEKIENKLINKKIEIRKDKKLNKSQSNDTMNVSEVSNDDKIMKINDFSGKIKNNILVDIDKNTDFNETRKIKVSKNNNININEIIKSNKKNTQSKDIKSIQYISKTKRISKRENGNNEEYTKEKNYFRKCIYKSIAGKDSLGNRKINQDLYLVQINFINIEGFNLFGVLDGHGENGHKVAIFTRDFIIFKLTSFFQKHSPNSLEEIYSLLKEDDFNIIKTIYQKTDKELQEQNFNSNFSGSTCVIVFQVGEKIICANVGDSRAILVYSSKIEDDKLSSTKIYELSHDQKPELPEEKKRIYKMGGIVDQMLDGNGKRNGPFRVWDGKNNYPGLAMSRCIGDLKGKKCGLISEPEIIEYNLDERSKYMVICSDGVWEFLNNEDVMRIGIDFYLKDNIGEFIDKIIKVSEFWWEKEDIIRDDITAVIVYF